jgi:uncharacterized Zn finger protein
MSCDNCAIRAEVRGRQMVVRLLWDHIEKIAASVERACFLYRCPECGTFWESCAYEPWPREVDALHVSTHYPDAQKWL